MAKQQTLSDQQVDEVMSQASPIERDQPAKQFDPPPEEAQTTAIVRAENGNGKSARSMILFSPEPHPLEFSDAQRLARAMLMARMAPDSWTAKCETKEDALAAVSLCLCFGAENGLTMTETISSVYIVRGRPTLWGDIIGAKVLRSGLLEDFGEEWSGAGDTRKAKVWAKRKGIPSRREIEFGYADAKRGGLTGKDTYKSWGDDMYARRAWGRLYYRLFPDVLKGMAVAEIEEDGEVSGREDRAADVTNRISHLDEPTASRDRPPAGALA